MFRHLLMVRFGLFNLIALALLGAAYVKGWLDEVIWAEFAYLSAVIVAVFFYGLTVCALKTAQTTRELNDVKEATPAPGSHAGKYLAATAGLKAGDRRLYSDMLRLKLTNRIAVVRHIANALVFLGLIGTVIGFIIALSGVDPRAAADAQQVGKVISSLIGGMSVALHTTLVGSVAYVWLIIDHRVLARGTLNLYTATIERGEEENRNQSDG